MAAEATTNRAVLDDDAGGLRTERVIGRFGDPKTGSTLIVIGGQHGNEPAGVRAIQRVCDAMRARGFPLGGALVALTGNRAALAENQRLIDADMNRMWTVQRIERLRAAGPDGGQNAEEQELAELLAEVDALAGATRDSVYLLDLHTTSGDTAPFTVFCDTLTQQAFARQFPVPMILGLVEALDNTITEFAQREGWTAVAFEGGQHDDLEAVDCHEAAIWLALAAAGVMAVDSIPAYERHVSKLRELRGDLPDVLEVVHRESITPEDGYVMRPGFATFSEVRLGDLLGQSSHGEVRAPRDGVLLMPLYQGRGTEAFFIGEETPSLRMHVARLMRQGGLARLARRLPGVQWRVERPLELRVDEDAAEWVRRWIRALGFRREGAPQRGARGYSAWPAIDSRRRATRDSQ